MKEDEILNPGERVVHTVFGPGTVKSHGEGVLAVMFDKVSGDPRRYLLWSFAHSKLEREQKPGGSIETPNDLPYAAEFLKRRRANAVTDVIAERIRQDKKWGEQNHDPYLYLTILGEEFGETCKAALEARFRKDPVEKANWSQELRKEAVQTAAVALAIVECLDRQKWAWGSHKES